MHGLFKPSQNDLDDIAGDLASLAGSDSLFAVPAVEKLERLQYELRPLAERYDVVVANPPYMGSNNMNKWLADWTKKAYPNSKRDLCTCFIERGQNLAIENGYQAQITSDTCMYISSFEQLRKNILSRSTIVGFIDTRGTNAHPDVFDANAGWVLFNAHAENVAGTYFKLNQAIADKEARFLEALEDPKCGWRFIANGAKYADIPGNALVYWASNAAISAFRKGMPIRSIGEPRQGLATGKNDLFVRQWWEVSLLREWFECPSIEASLSSGKRWFPYNKGGEYRKWYGNNDCVVNWEHDGEDIKAFGGSVIRNPQCYFKPCITWSKVSSGSIAFRYKPQGHVFDVAGTSIFTEERKLKYLHGACNSSVILQIAGMLSPTLNFEVGQIAAYPIINADRQNGEICAKVDQLRKLSKEDWDSFETSWDFGRHPLA